MDYEIGWQDYGMRIYRPDIGRFGSVDPITSDYPELTPYQFASNSPIGGIDLDGLEFLSSAVLYSDRDNAAINKHNEQSVVSSIDGVTAFATSLPSAFGNGVAYGLGKYNNKIDAPFSAWRYSKEKSFHRSPINENFDGSISPEDGGRIVSGLLDVSAVGGILTSSLSRSAGSLGLSMEKMSIGTNAAERLKLLPQGMVPNAGGNIVSFTTLETETYYRVFSSNPNGGAFLTKVAPKSSAFAREGLALPKENTASFIQEVTVPSGVDLQRSRALGAFGRRGGSEQFQILNFDSRIKFHKGVPLKK